ncbi:DUF4366 domain-containing protein [Oscillibacter sp.]|uniref:DUF4366 domain-containing protein n=1 Tax=Oscillibacter sp. TaxID=1945593 RepID=UPI0028AE2579|nr:DUF4366 domain-containing protein [Oscillibacter sp.]
MKKFRLLTAALCAVVLLCGFSVTAYASGGDEPAVETGGTDLWEGLDPAEALPVETAEPVETENPFIPSGTGTVVDNATDEDGKEFFTITTPSENVFYLVIDRQRETENVYFLNAVTEADLLALAEMPEETVTPTPEPEPEPAVEPTPEPEATSNIGPLLLGLAVVLIGGGAAFFFKVYRPKHQQAAAPEEDYDTGADYDDVPPWDEDDTTGEDEE